MSARLPPTWLRVLREAHDLSRAGLAEFSGVSERDIKKAELEAAAKPEVLLHLAEFFGISARRAHRLLDRDHPRTSLRVVRGDMVPDE